MHKNEPIIGILREEKDPPDNRVPLSPEQCQALEKEYHGLRVWVQPSTNRAFADHEYREKGIELREDLSGCDYLFGVKEIPPEFLISGSTCFFFSHTIKKQPQNQKLLREVLRKKVTLLDYECLKDVQGKRVVAFGRYAGLVGAYNGLRAYGLKYNLFSLDPAWKHQALETLKGQFSKVHLRPGTKIVLTGGGRVAQGSMEVLDAVGIKRITPEEFLSYSDEEPVYCQLQTKDYHARITDGGFDLQEFYHHPERYKGTFTPFAKASDLLIAGAYWDPANPVLFTQEDMRQPGFRIRVVADITCDIDGSIPSTIRPSTISDPFYDVSLPGCREASLFSDPGNITVMAVDNLPNELARDASQAFGEQLMEYVFPCLMNADPDSIIENAVIARNGMLMPAYQYLSDYAEGKEG